MTDKTGRWKILPVTCAPSRNKTKKAEGGEKAHPTHRTEIKSNKGAIFEKRSCPGGGRAGGRA